MEGAPVRAGGAGAANGALAGPRSSQLDTEATCSCCHPAKMAATPKGGVGVAHHRDAVCVGAAHHRLNVAPDVQRGVCIAREDIIIA